MFTAFHGSFDGGNKSVSTARRMLQMLLNWFVVFLPSIEVTKTKIAGCIVWICGCWLVKEAGFCKLFAC